jgi:hypothetical protein
MNTPSNPGATRRPPTKSTFEASERRLSPRPRKNRGLRPPIVTLTMAAGLFLAALPSALHGSGNPVPISSDFYVSPTGNDSANGDSTAPLATLGKAKELAVAWIHQTDGSGNFINPAADIYLKAGRHALVSPAANPTAPGLEFTPADTRSGATITFRNAPGETAIIHGALEFVASNGPETGTWTPVTMDVYNGGTTTTSPPAPMISVNIQKYVFAGALRTELQTRIANLRAAGVNGGHFCFTELYVEDTRKTRARQPNARPLFADTRRFTVAPGNDPLANAQPVVRIDQRWVETTQGAPFTDYSPVVGTHTELIFTRAWQWGRGIITSATQEVVDGNQRMCARMAAMENPPIPGGYTYDEGQLADFSSGTSVNLTGQGETWNRGRLENNKLFVDRPGEWFFDDEEIALYYYPDVAEPITTQTFRIPVTHRLVALTGSETDNGGSSYTENFVHGVRFIGEGTGEFDENSLYRLQIEKSAWKYENNRGNSEYYSARHANYVQSGAIDGIHVVGLEVAYCKFTQFGGTAISLGGNRKWAKGAQDRGNYNNQVRGSVRNVIIDNNYFIDGGGSGIRLDDHPRRDSVTGRYPVGNIVNNNNITSNEIEFIGKHFADGVAIHVTHGIKTWVDHNSIRDVPFNGIVAGWDCHRDNNDPANERVQVRRNGVSRAMRMLMDGGGIYTAGGRHMIIVSNTMVNIGGVRDADANIAVSDPRLINDLYFDLTSQAFTISNNAASEIFSSRMGSHNFAGQGGSIFYTNPLNSTPCPNSDDGCCGENP